MLYLLVHFQHQGELSRLIAHCGLDEMDKTPEEQMHILFRFHSLNVIMPLQTQPCHILSYSIYSYHPKSTGNKIKYFIRLLFGCCVAEPSAAPSHKPLVTSCHRDAGGAGGLPCPLPTHCQGPCASPQSPAWLSSPTTRSFLLHP